MLFWHRHVKLPNSANYYFQQDGAIPHTAHFVKKWLNEKFSNRFVDKKKWPPRFVSYYFEDTVNPHNYLEVLKFFL